MTLEEKFVGYAATKPFVLNEKETYLKPMEFDPIPLDNDEVEILVAACGICGSDVHQITNGWKRAVYPLIPGHELIGKVTAVGADVKDVKLGDRVGVSPVSRSCNDCEQCNADHCQLCPKKVLTYNGTYKGRQTFGGYSNKVRVQSKWAIPIPDNISDAEGAPLLCAGITTFLPFKHYNIGPESSVGIVGIGGLGHLAVQWARAKGCKDVIAFSTSRRKEEETRGFGATDFAVCDSTGNFEPQYEQSVNCLFVCGTGSSTDWGKLLGLVKLRGKLIVLDLPEQPIPIPPPLFIYKHIQIVGSFVGSDVDLREMLAFASEHNVRPLVEKVGNSLEEVNRGVEALMNGKAHYRLVICGEGRALQ